VITPEELEALEPRKTKTIDIEDFVELDEIDPLYYDHPYYLLPGQGAQKPYKLLVEAMKQANKVAIARVVIRSKEQLVAIRPVGDVLAMASMNFADEVVDPDSFDEAPGEDVETRKREIEMAQQLIESLTTEFDPSKYHDTYRERVLEMIEAKAEGQEIAVQPAEEEAAPVPDLMAALEASLAAAKKDEPAGGGNGGEPKKKAGAAKKPAAKKKAAAEK
jgi:DNA end-binding protein Ku